MAIVILQGQAMTAQAIESMSHALSASVETRQDYAVLHCPHAVSGSQLSAFRQQFAFDINLIPDTFATVQPRLLVTDMDSTLIGIECVDEIADFINVKPQVAEITEAAMRGEIDFETSLRQRVSLLKGLEVSVLERVYQERLTLNPGADIMIRALKQHGIKIALVSGGFTFFTQRLQRRLGLDFTLANVLGEKDGRLTGEVEGDICGAQAKADFLQQLCEQIKIAPSQAVAMGDGANDLQMMDVAGLSIAYHAKPTVQQQADTAINYCGLEAVTGLLRL